MAKTLLDMSTRFFETLLDRPPEILYHYTDGNAFKAILEFRSLRATDVRYMNDFAELADGRRIIKKIVTEFLKSTTSDAIRKLSETILEDLTGWEVLSEEGPHDVTFTVDNQVFNVFTMSLSAEPDLLSQWRGYADNAFGYSIGFHAETIQIEAAKCPSARFLGLAPITYDDGKKETLIRALMKRWEQHTTEGKKGDPLGNANEYYWRFLQPAFGLLASTFKQQGFREENEWRLVFVKALEDFDQLKVRIRESTFVPYIDFKLSDPSAPKIIRDVVCGPKQVHKNNHHLIEGFARGLNFNFEVRNSSVSYR